MSNILTDRVRTETLKVGDQVRVPNGYGTVTEVPVAAKPATAEREREPEKQGSVRFRRHGNYNTIPLFAGNFADKVIDEGQGTPEDENDPSDPPRDYADVPENNESMAAGMNLQTQEPEPKEPVNTGPRFSKSLNKK